MENRVSQRRIEDTLRLKSQEHASETRIALNSQPAQQPSRAFAYIQAPVYHN